MTISRRSLVLAGAGLGSFGIGAIAVSTVGTTFAGWKDYEPLTYGTEPTPSVDPTSPNPTSPSHQGSWSGNALVENLYVHPSAVRTGFAPGSTNYYTGQVMCDPKNADTCASGRDIVALGTTRRGTLVGGYGEWSLNVDSFGTDEGRPAIRELDPEGNGTWGNPVAVGSEAIDSVYTGPDGSMLVPTTDPSDKPGKGQSSGYWTDESGSWELVSIPGQEHVFGAYRTPEGATYISGSAGDRGKVWRAAPGSRDFAEIFSSDSGGGYARVFWVSGDGHGTIYFALTGTDPYGIYTYDETTATVARAKGAVQTSAVTPAFAVSFDGGFQFAASQAESLYSETGIVKPFRQVLFGCASIDGQSIYLVSSEMRVYQADCGYTSMREVARIPWDAKCISVIEKDIYAGGPKGQIGKITRTAD